MPQDALREELMVMTHEIKSHGRGQEAPKTKPDTSTRPPTPTEDQKNGAEGGFPVFPVWTIFMRVVVVSSVSVAGQI